MVVCDENSYNDGLTTWIKQSPLLINRQNELNTCMDSRYILFSVGYVLMFGKKTSIREWRFIIHEVNSEFYILSQTLFNIIKSVNLGRNLPLILPFQSMWKFWCRFKRSVCVALFTFKWMLSHVFTEFILRCSFCLTHTSLLQFPQFFNRGKKRLNVKQHWSFDPGVSTHPR